MMATAWSKAVDGVKVTRTNSGMEVGEALWMRDNGVGVLGGAEPAVLGAHAAIPSAATSATSNTAPSQDAVLKVGG